MGTGVLVSPDGYIVTNAHVVDNALEVVVTLPGGKSYDAQVIGVDNPSDIALVKIEDENLIAFKYCDESGNTNENSNPNGSIKNIAGILNKKNNILGMMPHPERAFENYHCSQDGFKIMKNLLKHILRNFQIFGIKEIMQKKLKLMDILFMEDLMQH